MIYNIGGENLSSGNSAWIFFSFFLFAIGYSNRRDALMINYKINNQSIIINNIFCYERRLEFRRLVSWHGAKNICINKRRLIL